MIAGNRATDDTGSAGGNRGRVYAIVAVLAMTISCAMGFLGYSMLSRYATGGGQDDRSSHIGDQSQIKLSGRWTCSKVWEDGEKHSPREYGLHGSYMDFHSDGSVVWFKSSATIGKYSYDGESGTITGIGEESGARFDISSDMMRVFYPTLGDDIFVTYRWSSEAPEIQDNENLSAEQREGYAKARPQTKDKKMK